MTCQLKYIFSFIKSLVIVMERAWLVQPLKSFSFPSLLLLTCLKLPCPLPFLTDCPVPWRLPGWGLATLASQFSCLMESLFIWFLIILPNVNTRGIPMSRTVSPLWAEWPEEIDPLRKVIHPKSLLTLGRFFISAAWWPKWPQLLTSPCSLKLFREFRDLYWWNCGGIKGPQ